MKRYFLIIFIAIIAFQSCKEKNNPDPEILGPVTDFLPLKIGNYWVYERSSCDSTWTDCTTLSQDTCRITKDTIINDKLYYKLEGKNILNVDVPLFLRDSGDYIVNSMGYIYLSIDEVNIIISEEYIINTPDTDTLYYMFRDMVGYPNKVVVPAGTFDCIDNRTTLFKVKEGINEGISAHNYYAKNVGRVYENVLYTSSLGGIQSQLIGYHVDN